MYTAHLLVVLFLCGILYPLPYIAFSLLVFLLPVVYYSFLLLLLPLKETLLYCCRLLKLKNFHRWYLSFFFYLTGLFSVFYIEFDDLDTPAKCALPKTPIYKIATRLLVILTVGQLLLENIFLICCCLLTVLLFLFHFH